MNKKIKIKDIHIMYNLFSEEEMSIFSEVFSSFAFKASLWGIPEKPRDNHSSIDWSQAGKDEHLASLASQVDSILKIKNNFLRKEIEKDFNCLVDHEENSSIIKCGPGFLIDLHWDQIGSSGDLLPTFSGHPRRDYSTVMYFNDNFTGGNLIFPYLGIEIEPVAASVVYFPSTDRYEHAVTEILSGHRITSAGFWHATEKGN